MGALYPNYFIERFVVFFFDEADEVDPRVLIVDFLEICSFHFFEEVEYIAIYFFFLLPENLLGTFELFLLLTELSKKLQIPLSGLLEQSQVVAVGSDHIQDGTVLDAIQERVQVEQIGLLDGTEEG